ncbi:MAG: hypothetical protein AAF268_01040 [Cyanobacteria bacterium P01_A01_bin.3]
MYYINSASAFAAASRQLERWKCLLYSSLLGGGEPTVWSLKDRYGVPYWLVCDPQSDRPLEARTDDEVRQILEQRYRQSTLRK